MADSNWVMVWHKILRFLDFRQYLKPKLADRVFSFRNVSVLAEVGTASYGIVVNYIVVSQIQNALSTASLSGLVEADMVLLFGIVSAVVYVFVVPRLTARILILDNERVLELMLQLGVDSKLIRGVVFRSYVLYVLRAGWRVLVFEFLTAVFLYFLLAQLGANVVLHVTSFMISTIFAIALYVPISCYFGARGVERWYAAEFAEGRSELE